MPTAMWARSVRQLKFTVILMTMLHRRSHFEGLQPSLTLLTSSSVLSRAVVCSARLAHCAVDTDEPLQNNLKNVSGGVSTEVAGLVCSKSSSSTLKEKLQ
jgi:hypothetical protein